MKNATKFWLKISSSLLLLTLALTSCNSTSKPVEKTTSTPLPSSTVKVSPEPRDKSGNIKFKRDGNTAAFDLKLLPDGAKLVDKNDKELARFNVDNKQKVKIKNSADKVLGYIVAKDGAWKIENPEQNKELYVLRRQADGDYKLESGSDRPIYRLKSRPYGWEIEDNNKKSLYKVKAKEGKISLRNAADQTILYTKSSILPVAMACFGLDVLTPEQKAALAFAVNRTGGI